MKGPKTKAREYGKNSTAALVCYECPLCKMLMWSGSHPSEATCPFCCNPLPGYVTKVAPERMIMRNKLEQADSFGQRISGGGKENGASPFVLEFFMVQGADFRCMAYRNNDGKWRGAFDNCELPGTVRVLE